MIPFLQYVHRINLNPRLIRIREKIFIQFSDFPRLILRKKGTTRNRLIVQRGGKRTSYRWVHDPSGGKSGAPPPLPDAKTWRNRSLLRAVPVNREENRAKHGSTPSMFARARAHTHARTYTGTCTSIWRNWTRQEAHEGRVSCV